MSDWKPGDECWVWDCASPVKTTVLGLSAIGNLFVDTKTTPPIWHCYAAEIVYRTADECWRAHIDELRRIELAAIDKRRAASSAYFEWKESKPWPDEKVIDAPGTKYVAEAAYVQINVIDGSLAFGLVYYPDGCSMGGAWNLDGTPKVPELPHIICKYRDCVPTPSPPTPQPWDSPEDVPMPVCWIRVDNGRPRLVLEFNEHGVYVNGTLVEWKNIRHWQHSTDGREWKPCVKGGGT